ncbi:MAG: hypothetical protein EBU90_00345 [Proteobacteria bacterium]|nr:hypothetical protein [Pseudomonadota bacterium]NBP12880.1 hypothetical protein [bacterium]
MSDTIIINPSNDCDSIVINPIVDNETIIINGKGAVNSVNGRIGDVVLNSSDVGLSIVNTNSANWDSSYSSVYANSALWTQGGNSVALQSLSSTWNSNYITTNSLSSFWSKGYQYGTAYSSNSANFATIQFVDGKFLAISGGEIKGDLTIHGSLTALGQSTFVDTIFTTTSALSVINLGVGPALYVYQAATPYDVASFVDGDGVEVLHIGNSNGNDKRGKIGINESFPSVELTVKGRISASETFYANGIENQGIITTTGLALQNSRVQYLDRPVTANGNFILLNVNNELQAIRLFSPIMVGINFTNALGDGDWSNLGNWSDIQGYPINFLPDVLSEIDFNEHSIGQISSGEASIKSANFYGSSVWTDSITLTVSNSATFFDDSRLYGTIEGDVILKDNSITGGEITGNAFLSGSAINNGLILGNATFTDASTNTGQVVGNATVYYPSPYPIGGLVNGSVSYRGYFATKFLGTAGDGDWNNIANWVDDFNLPVVFLPSSTSNVKIYSDVTSTDLSGVMVNSAIFYSDATWGTGLSLSADNITFNSHSSNQGTLVATDLSPFRFYNYSSNSGTIVGDAEVHYPVEAPIGGTITGNITYIGYQIPIVSPQLIDIQGPSNITDIQISCNGYNLFPTFDPSITDYAVGTNTGGGYQVSYDLTINGVTTSGTANVDQALQIYNTNKIYYIRFINNNVPLGNVTTAPQAGYVPGYYTIGYNDYYPIIFDHNGVPVWYTGNTAAISLHKGKNRNRVVTNYQGGPQYTIQIGASALSTASYQLVRGDYWDIHETQEIAAPPNRAGNIMGISYANGFYLEEQDPSHNIIWDWNSINYFNDTYYDRFHLNSVDVHPTSGNVLLSLRHTGSVVCINYITKNVMWVISGRYPWCCGGGDLESIAIGTGTQNTKWISDTHGNILNEPTYQGYTYSGTVGNHDARWHPEIAPIHGPNNVVISIFDDESTGDFPGNTAPACRGVIYEIDESSGIAYHRSSVFSPNGTSAYRGSFTVIHEADGSWSQSMNTCDQFPKLLEFSSSSIDSPVKPLVFAMDFGGIPYRIIKIEKDFFDLNNLRATVGLPF